MATRFWMLECLLAISYTDETKDAALKGGATRSPLPGVATQALEAPTP